MNKTYCFKICYPNGEAFRSMNYDTIEDCVNKCKKMCLKHQINYDSNDVKLFLTNDFGETYEECTEEGELAG